MSGLTDVIIAIRAKVEPSSIGYLKSRDIARVTDLSAREVGARLAYLRDAEDAPLEVSRWSESGNAVTYRVEIEDHTWLDEYVEDVQSGTEPNLNAHNDA